MIKINKFIKNQDGSVLVFVTLSLLGFLAFCALAIDVGYMYASRNQLQNAVDAAALAGAGQLGNQRWEDADDQVTDPDKIIAVAQEVLSKNPVAGEGVNTSNSEIEIEAGEWDHTATPKFNPSAPVEKWDAVRVTVHKNNIGAFFSKLVGKDFFDVAADATAALSGLLKMAEGELEIPVGISTAWFDEENWEPGSFCDQPIKFYPTGDMEGCAGWNTFDESPANANTLKDILDGLKDGTYESPEVISDSTSLEFTGGTVSSAFDNMNATYEEFKDPVTGEWETTAVVYDYDDCSNPTGSIKIVGFVTVVITDILSAPDKIIQAEVICDQVEDNRGGGGEYGTMGRIPGLVE